MPKILTPLQSKFLNEFFLHTQDFYLTGGTALSVFYLQHRYSVDLDLFTQKDEGFKQVEHLVREICTNLNVDFTAVQITKYFKHFVVGNPGSLLTLHFSRDFSIQTKTSKTVR